MKILKCYNCKNKLNYLNDSLTGRCRIPLKLLKYFSLKINSIIYLKIYILNENLISSSSLSSSSLDASNCFSNNSSIPSHSNSNDNDNSNENISHSSPFLSNFDSIHNQNVITFHILCTVWPYLEDSTNINEIILDDNVIMGKKVEWNVGNCEVILYSIYFFYFI